MKYTEFERIISKKRMGRYLNACGGDTRKAMTLHESPEPTVADRRVKHRG